MRSALAHMLCIRFLIFHYLCACMCCCICIQMLPARMRSKAANVQEQQVQAAKVAAIEAAIAGGTTEEKPLEGTEA